MLWLWLLLQVLEYIPETVYSVARQYQKAKQAVPLLQVKLYVYQLARALAHIHGLGICHRCVPAPLPARVPRVCVRLLNKKLAGT